MKLKDIPQDELELMNYDDIAYLILEQEKKKMKINDLFKKVCDLLGLSEEEYITQIADFFEMLTLNKKFVMLENGYWDLRTRHSEKIVIDDDDDDYEEVSEPEKEEETTEEEDTTYDKETEDDDAPDDDLKDFMIVDEEEDGL